MIRQYCVWKGETITTFLPSKGTFNCITRMLALARVFTNVTWRSRAKRAHVTNVIWWKTTTQFGSWKEEKGGNGGRTVCADFWIRTLDCPKHFTTKNDFGGGGGWWGWFMTKINHQALANYLLLQYLCRHFGTLSRLLLLPKAMAYSSQRHTRYTNKDRKKAANPPGWPSSS